jgi:hypothetical protein
MEPVSSCSVGASFPRLPVFRTAATPKTTIAASTTLSSVLHLGLIQGPRKRLRIRAHAKERVSRRRLLVVRAYNPLLNISLRKCSAGRCGSRCIPAFLCIICIVFTVETRVVFGQQLLKKR